MPLFILLGSLANHAGIADRLFDFALALMGRVRGGLGYVSVGVSLGFSWMSGSAVADAAALSKVEIPAMVRNGYSMRFGLGVVGSSALIAPVMPPSIPAVIYAGLAAVSTGALFAASVIPAMLMAIGLCIVVFLLVRRQPDIVHTGFSWERLRRTGTRVIGPLGAPVIILGGILYGLFTPTEAAAVGALYMLLLGLAYRTLRLRDLLRVLSETVMTTAAIRRPSPRRPWLCPGPRAGAAGPLRAGPGTDRQQHGVHAARGRADAGPRHRRRRDRDPGPHRADPDADRDAAGGRPHRAGRPDDPLAHDRSATPPVGTVLYVLGSTQRVPVSQVFAGALPFLVPLVTICLLIIFFPGFVTWLPHRLGL